MAALGDLLSLMPFVGSFVGPIFWVLTGIYFWIEGMGIMNGKRLATGAISMVAELIPAIQALPSLIVGIIVVIGMSRIEEKTGISLMNLKNNKSRISQNGVTPPRLNRAPVNNQQGIRYPNKN